MIDLLIDLLNMSTEELTHRDHILNTAIYVDLMEKSGHPFKLPKDLSRETCKQTSMEAMNATITIIDNLLNKQTISPEKPVLVGLNNIGITITPTEQVSITEDIKIIILNLIAQKEFEVNRIKNCAKCGIFFYQHNRKSQKFCTRRCSDSGRTTKHQPKLNTAKET